MARGAGAAFFSRVWPTSVLVAACATADPSDAPVENPPDTYPAEVYRQPSPTPPPYLRVAAKTHEASPTNAPPGTEKESAPAELRLTTGASFSQIACDPDRPRIAVSLARATQVWNLDERRVASATRGPAHQRIFLADGGKRLVVIRTPFRQALTAIVYAEGKFETPTEVELEASVLPIVGKERAVDRANLDWLVVSPDGRRAAGGWLQNPVAKVWRLSDGRAERTLRAPFDKGRPVSGAFSPDSTRLALAGFEGIATFPIASGEGRQIKHPVPGARSLQWIAAEAIATSWSHRNTTHIEQWPLGSSTLRPVTSVSGAEELVATSPKADLFALGGNLLVNAKGQVVHRTIKESPSHCIANGGRWGAKITWQRNEVELYRVSDGARLYLLAANDTIAAYTRDGRVDAPAEVFERLRPFSRKAKAPPQTRTEGLLQAFVRGEKLP